MMNMTLKQILGGMLAALLLAGCQSNPYSMSQRTGKQVDKTLAEAEGKTKSGLPPDVNQALLPGAAPRAGAAPLEARYDIAVNNAPVRQVYLNLVESTPYSLVLSPEVAGNVTLNLKNITVPEAFDAIRHAYGYDYRRVGTRFTVHGNGMQMRIFPVNYLNFERLGASRTRVVPGELTTGGASTRSGTSSSGTQPPAQTGTTAGSQAGVQVETRTKMDFWKDLGDTLTEIIGKGPGRKVVVNPQSGVVLVRAMPDEMRLVEDFLGIAATNLSRQVVIEAKILNVRLSNEYQTGINWAAMRGSSTFAQTGGGTSLNSGLSEIAGNAATLPTPPAGGSTSAFGGVFSVAIQATNFGAFLEMLQGQGDVQVLSSPRVSTLNNQKAVIKVGGDAYFITGVTSTPSTVVGGAPTTEVQVTPFFSGITLDVTPQISDDGSINLHIHPAVSEVTDATKSFTLNGQASSLPLAISSIQESDNVVRARSGQFVVIGGLMKEGTTDDNAGIPLLGDIPIVGNLFKHKRVTRIKNELVILLRPTIVEDGDNTLFSEDIGAARERIRKQRTE